MPSLIELAWIIPFAPFAGGIFVLLLLISFNRTMNRLSRPVSYLLATCVASSTALSFTLFEKHLSGQVLDWDLSMVSMDFRLSLYVDSIATITSAICGLVILTVVILSYYLLDRKEGYVRYLVLLGISSGSIFTFILSGNLFHSLF